MSRFTTPLTEAERTDFFSTVMTYQLVEALRLHDALLRRVSTLKVGSREWFDAKCDLRMVKEWVKHLRGLEQNWNDSTPFQMHDTVTTNLRWYADNQYASAGFAAILNAIVQRYAC
jgi:hypothetical protein